MVDSPIRTFDTGATRSSLEGKSQYEGYLSPLVLHRFGQYMTAHRKQADGSLRAADNWQKGMTKDSYLDSLLRHVIDVWLIHRGCPDVATESLEEALCAALFNVQGYLHEHLKAKRGAVSPPAPWRATPENCPVGTVVHYRMGSLPAKVGRVAEWDPTIPGCLASIASHKEVRNVLASEITGLWVAGPDTLPMGSRFQYRASNGAVWCGAVGGQATSLPSFEATDLTRDGHPWTHYPVWFSYIGCQPDLS